MKLGELLEISSRRQWRKWLSQHHSKKPEIWLVYNRKSSGRSRISYNDAVEEALCFGWIDSTVKGIDKERFAQRFSPRKSNSKLSEMNRQRIRKLIAEDQMTRAGLDAVAKVFDPEEGTKFELPAYIERALKAEDGAWENFDKFPESYKRIRIAYIEGQKKHGRAQHQRALNHFVKMTAKNKRIGFVKEFN